MNDDQNIDEDTGSLLSKNELNRISEAKKRNDRRKKAKADSIRKKRAAAKQRKATSKKVRPSETEVEPTRTHDNSQIANDERSLHQLDLTKPAAETLAVEDCALGLPDFEDAAVEESKDDEQRGELLERWQHRADEPIDIVVVEDAIEEDEDLKEEVRGPALRLEFPLSVEGK